MLMRAPTKRLWACVMFMLGFAGVCTADISRAGGAGYALLFRDHGVVIENLQGMDTDAFTFEAWLSTASYCQKSAIMSYAQQSTSTDPRQRTADFNDFVIFDPKNLVACRGFEYIDLWPDPRAESCYSNFNHSDSLPSIVERDGCWHHLAVTWTAANNGLTKIYIDGLLRAETPTGKTAVLRSGGALMLGGEQDCYGGCTDMGQGYHGYMDEVRLWRVARSQEDLLKHMRDYTGLENHPDLIAYWKFNDPEQNGMFRQSKFAVDSSGRGNDLPLITLPKASMQRIESTVQGGKSVDAGVLSFANNYAMNQGFPGMPEKDVSIEFWARVPKYNASQEVWSEFLSFATFINNQGSAQTQFLDDAILIERYTQEFSGSEWIDFSDVSTAGSISIHINANREGMGKDNDHWIDYAVQWMDAGWHHIAMTWTHSTGEVSLYFDGKAQVPFWVSKAGKVQAKDPRKGGVDRHIAAGTARSTSGSLVLGNKQECMGGCFSPQYALHGDLANLRIWNRVVSEREVGDNMFTVDPTNKDGLVFNYNFDPSLLQTAPDGQVRLTDTFNMGHNDLYFGADAPTWVYSTAPLADALGVPVGPPLPGSAGHAMHLSDQQVLIAKNFVGFPSDEITVEFWMLSTDACRKGTPFSYASAGATYSNNDNTFLISDYNNWVVGVLEDEGYFRDHTSGISATDGKWHHIAVTWRSSDGSTKLYDNGVEVWSVVRSKGMKLPSGGTLVIGREQDCEGGCFDSDIGGARGPVSDEWNAEYGSQDFFGVLDELRIWRRVRTVEEIQAGMRANLYTKGRTGEKSGSDAGSGINPADPDLVAYYNFDEGQGYTVTDVTNRGNNLIATQPPKWEVVKSLSICGNGVLEGLEECDDGETADGDGCSAECKIEGGWECTRTSPSICWRSGDAPPPGPVDPRGGPTPAPSPSSGGSGGKKKHSGHFMTVVFSFALVAGLLGMVVLRRREIYTRFPAVETTVDHLSDRAHSLYDRLLGRRYTYGGDGELSLDIEDHAGTPDFSVMRPEPARTAGYDALSGQEPLDR